MYYFTVTLYCFDCTSFTVLITHLLLGNLMMLLRILWVRNSNFFDQTGSRLIYFIANFGLHSVACIFTILHWLSRSSFLAIFQFVCSFICKFICVLFTLTFITRLLWSIFTQWNWLLSLSAFTSLLLDGFVCSIINFQIRFRHFESRCLSWCKESFPISVVGFGEHIIILSWHFYML